MKTVAAYEGGGWWLTVAGPAVPILAVLLTLLWFVVYGRTVGHELPAYVLGVADAKPSAGDAVKLMYHASSNHVLSLLDLFDRLVGAPSPTQRRWYGDGLTLSGALRGATRSVRGAVNLLALALLLLALLGLLLAARSGSRLFFEVSWFRALFPLSFLALFLVLTVPGSVALWCRRYVRVGRTRVPIPPAPRAETTF